MRFQRIIEQVYFRPWFITAEGHASISKLIESKLAQTPGVKADFVEMSDFFMQRQPLRMDDDDIAHIHVFGVLGQGLAPIEKTCGNTDYADICADVRAAEGAAGIMFHIDSPGGMCSGCIETAKLIANITEKPTVAFVNNMACSAAYAIAAACGYVFATESALIGSIGTICPWVDSSAMWEKAGLSFQPIVSEGADLKSSMHGPSITDEQRAAEQELVNEYGAQFTGFVKARRDPDPVVFRAGAYTGGRAFELRLVDQVTSEGAAKDSLLAMIAQ